MESLTFESRETNNSIIDSDLAIYSGSIGNLTEIACADVGGEDFSPLINLTNLTPGEILFVRLWTYSSSNGSEYLISAFDDNITLSINDDLITKNALNYYPNPVVDFLTISSQLSNIDTVSLFNLNDKEVKVSQEINAGSAKLNISNLYSGIYLTRVTINNKTEVIKVIKN